MRLAAVSCLLLLALASSPAAARDDDFDALVAAERAFAATSPREGVGAAFRAWMAPDAILFRPGPKVAAAYYAAQPAQADTVLLDWAPERAEVSASGDLGWTIGPALLRAKDKPGEASGTHFFSIWQRNAAGEFRNVLDLGVNHEPVELSKTVARHGPRRARAEALSAAQAAVRLQELLTADRALAAKLATGAAAAAWRDAATVDAIVLRHGSLPLQGDAARAKLARQPATDLASIRIAAAGDLGATAGWGGDPAKPSLYQRAWRYEDGAWRVVVDLTTP
ncbi:MAG TPA: hypothetical protein VND91_10165 [Candidatus Saccharimonadia bacterium]|nr:hypothetical protein [Candidatus Saccharimonadia bacterium]